MWTIGAPVVVLPRGNGPCSVELSLNVARHVTWLLGEALDTIWSPTSDDWMSAHYSEDSMTHTFTSDDDTEGSAA
jgi:hypothetical protein